MAAIRSPRRPTSAGQPRMPEPSTSVPPWITRSKGAVAEVCCAYRAAASTTANGHRKSRGRLMSGLGYQGGKLAGRSRELSDRRAHHLLRQGRVQVADG